MFENNDDFNFDDVPEFLETNFVTSSSATETVNLTVSNNIKNTKYQSSNNHTINQINSNINQNQTSPLKAPINTRKRKFPGPAGILPEIEDFSLNQKLLEKETLELSPSQSQTTQSLLCSQSTASNMFQSLPWLEMCKDFSSNLDFLPDVYNIKWIKRTAKAKKLKNQKAPFLAAIIKCIDVVKEKMPYATLTLQDLSGEIQGSTSHVIYEKYMNELTINSVLIFRQVGILSTQYDRHYLMITENNLVRIYSSQKRKVNNDEDKNDDNVINLDLSNKSLNISKTTNANESGRSSESFEEIEDVKVLSLHPFTVQGFLKSCEEVKMRKELNVNGGNISNKKNSSDNVTKQKFNFKACRPNLKNEKESVNSILSKTTEIKNSNIFEDANELFDLSDIDFYEEPTTSTLKQNEVCCQDKVIKLNTTHEENISPVKPATQIIITNCESNNKHKDLLEDIFSGVDADSLFDEF